MATPDDVVRIIAKTTELANTFHDLGLPVIWVHAVGLPKGRVEFSPPIGEPRPDFTQLHDELPVKEGDLKISKLGTSAFLSQELHSRLNEHDVTNEIVTGLALGGGVESTVRCRLLFNDRSA